MMKWVQKSKTILSVLLALSFGLAFGCTNTSSYTSKSKAESSEVSTTTEEITEVSSSEEVQTTTETSDLPAPSETDASDEDGLVVHFIDVDQGDASLIICDGEAMLIDGGSSYKSELIYAYLEKHEITHLKYIVATHPDDDHIGGLSAVLNIATVERAFCSVKEYDSKPFSNFQKYLTKQNVELEVPEAGTQLDLGGAKLTVLAPIQELEGTNNNSIVIRLEYGDISFLFTGDAEFDEENTIISSNLQFNSSVLKIGHHGSEYSTSKAFLDAVSPSFAIISCGKDNDYAFPKQTVLDLLKERNVKLYRTDMHGDIKVYSNGEKISVSTEKEPDGDVFLAPVIESQDPGSEVDCDYICNKYSHKFHYPNCEAVRKMKESNKLYFSGTRQELIDDGYTPCTMCNP